MYADGIRHSLELPYMLFEDQRSGETLGKLQKVRTDVEKFITSASIWSLPPDRDGFRHHLRHEGALVHRAGLPVHGAGARRAQFGAQPKDQERPEDIVKETTALAGSTTESCAT